MQTAIFNEAQKELLKMMSFVDTPKALDDLKQVISDFFANKMQEEIDYLWENGELNEEKVNSFKNLHQRTPYND
ncbi:MAG: dephospho-CoA kinase [Bacteroidales bacterium]|nr:dephospho-CoA kinase [Bacteroidales bacterium]